MYRKNKKPFYKNKPWLLIVIVVLLLGGGALAFRQFSNDRNTDQDTTQTSDNSENSVNISPPTEEEKKETAENKDSLVQDHPRPAPTNPADGKKQVTPIITSANGTDVRAYVTGIFEDGGTCTATATKTGQTKTASSTGFADFNKTTCAPIKLALSGSGWTVTVNYNSATASGTSAPFEVN